MKEGGEVNNVSGDPMAGRERICGTVRRPQCLPWIWGHKNARVASSTRRETSGFRARFVQEVTEGKGRRDVKLTNF